MILGLPTEYKDEARLEHFLKSLPLNISDVIESVRVVRKADLLLKQVMAREDDVKNLESSYYQLSATGVEPVGKVQGKFLNLIGGQTVNKINFYEETTLQQEEAIQLRRSEAGKSDDGRLDVAFITFSYPTLASTLSQITWFKGSTVYLAPAPSDVVWENLSMGKAQRVTRKWIVFGLMFALTFLWTVINQMFSISSHNLPFFRSPLVSSLVSLPFRTCKNNFHGSLLSLRIKSLEESYPGSCRLSL